MITFQDFEKADNKTEFLLNAIDKHKKSETYTRAKTAQAYYERDNTAIVERLTFLEKFGVQGSKVKFFKMRNGFFNRMCKQAAGYLLGNGVTLSADIKARLGNRFDKDLFMAGLGALIDGVNWCFWNVDRLVVFRATEFAPLFDEYTGEIMAGIRFWQIDKEKPLNVEFFEIDGITKYAVKSDNGGAKEIEIIAPKTPYVQKIREDDLGSEIVDTENYSKIPVFPFYANELKKSELTNGLRESIDAYDFIHSDMVDGILQIEGIYWVLKNYGGQDVTEFRAEIQQFKASHSDGKDWGVDHYNVEVPHKAKAIALELLASNMFEETMSLDIKAVTGGSLTNVAINTSKTDLDLKTDIFEASAVDLVANILRLLDIDEIPRFKRRTITNDTESISNISTMMSDGYVDRRWAVENNPLIADEQQEELLARLDEEDAGVPALDRGLDEVINGGLGDETDR